MNIRKLLVLSLVAVSIINCTDDNDPKPTDPKEVDQNILIETTVYNPDGLSGSSYIQLIPEFNGFIGNSNALQLDFGSTISFVGSDFYIFPSFGPNATNEIRKFTKTKNSFNQVGSLATPPFSNPCQVVSVHSNKAYVPFSNLGTVWIIDPQTMEKTGEIDLAPYAYADTSPNPAAGYIRNGKYYLALNQINAQYLPYDDYRQIDVIVINTTTDEVEDLVQEKTSQLSFPTRLYQPDMIFTNENNDLYITCAGYFGLNPQYPQTGFVCIPAGQNDFDTSLSWDISSTPIEGSNYTAASIFTSTYIGNDKVAAFVVIPELSNGNPYTSKKYMPVIIDLKNKTIKKLNVVSNSSGHGCFVGKYKDLIVFGSDGADNVGFYTYDPSTEKEEFVLGTTGAPFYMHYFD